jgi:hypothetical protein
MRFNFVYFGLGHAICVMEEHKATLLITTKRDTFNVTAAGESHL